MVKRNNNTAHITIQKTPRDALEEGNEISRTSNMWAKSKNDRVCSELVTGNVIRAILTGSGNTKNMPLVLLEISKVRSYV